MPEITNNTNDEMSFRVGKKTDSIPAKETKDLDVDMESAQVKGRIIAGAISVKGAAARKAGVEPATAAKK
jgi:hypothetical protein